MSSRVISPSMTDHPDNTKFRAKFFIPVSGACAMNVSRSFMKTIAIVTSAFLLSSFTFAQVEVKHPEAHDTSKPLREMKAIPPQWDNMNEHPVLPVPHGSKGGKDTAIQTSGSTSAATISGITNFDGVGVTTGYPVSGEPPDTNGSVGATQYVQWVNTAFAVYDKATGNKVYPASGYAAGNTIWSGFNTGNCGTNNDGDPIVLYDKQAQRWIFTQFSVSTKPYYQCVAVSLTSDATGPYNRYAYSFGTNFNDYPKVGVWTDGYYFTFNLFARGRSFAGADLCAMDRTTAMSGGVAKMLCFQTGTSFGGVLPADLDGATGATGSTAPPPPGTAEYFVNFGSNALNVWRMKPNYTAGTLSVTGPTSIPVAAFSEACSGGTCIPQSGTSQKLDSLADRLMYRLSYRNFGTYASLLVNHSVNVGAKRSAYSGIRWYELRVTNNTPSVYQQGTFAPDSNYRWMGSMAMEKLGNIGLGYSKSSGTVFPSI